MSVQIYADNTVLYVSGKDGNWAAKTLKVGLNKLLDWCKAIKSNCKENYADDLWNEALD